MLSQQEHDLLVTKINQSRGWSEIPATEIIPNVWLGTVWNADGLFDSNPNHIVGVIDIGPNPSYSWQGRDVRLRLAQGIEYSQVYFLDDGPVAKEDFWKQVTKGKAFLDAKVPFLVHCTLGSNRSASILASIFQYSGVMAFDDAVKLMNKLRPFVRPSKPLVAICKDYLNQGKQ